MRTSSAGSGSAIQRLYAGRTVPDALDKKRPERPASVPCRSFEALQPGRGADPRYPLGPPLMLSPVALPGTGALDGISDPFPLADPSGREEIYGPLTDRATDLSTKTRRDRRILSTTSRGFSTVRQQRSLLQGRVETTSVPALTGGHAATRGESEGVWGPAPTLKIEACPIRSSTP